MKGVFCNLEACQQGRLQDLLRIGILVCLVSIQSFMNSNISGRKYISRLGMVSAKLDFATVSNYIIIVNNHDL